jgi:DnaJ-class molecular chaperone
VTYEERKAERVAHYKKFVEGWKSIPCGACNGSGYYDHNGSPKCGCCGGSGKEKVSPERYQRYLNFLEDWK